MRIVNDLLFFCNYAGAKEYNVSIKPQPDSTYFEIVANIPNLSAENLETLQSALKLGRSHEVEQNYWELESGTNGSCELTLIGMMLDESTASYKDGVLKIVATRRD